VHWAYRWLAAAMIVGACAAPKEPIPITPPGETAASPVVRRTLPEPSPPPQVASVAPRAPAAAVPPVVVPAGALSKVAELCRKHPEMGPCQYEREVCRRSGGRVYAANGDEITKQTEAEYDKKVLRVRFKSN
jgi:hypothetical protein